MSISIITSLKKLRMKKKSPLLFTAVCMLCNIATFATNYFVSTTGNNSSNGTSLTTPFRTIQKALDVSAAGSIISVRAGTYKERLFWSKSGTSALPITLTNYNSEIVFLDGGSGGTNTAQNGMIEMSNISYIRINGIQVRNNYRNNAAGIYIVGSGNDVQISNCKIFNLGWTSNANLIPNDTLNANGIFFQGSSATAYSNIYIGFNELYNCVTGFSEVLSMNGNINNFLIEGNSIHDNTNIGIDMSGFYSWTGAPANVNQARNGNVINNTVYRCVSKVATSAGIYVDGGKWINIQGNKTYENGYGIEVGCENDNGIVEGVNVRNNFAYNNKDAGMAIGAVGANSVLQYSSVTGNTLYKNFSIGGYGGEIVLQKTNNVSLRSNIIYSRSDVVIISGAGYLSTNLSMDYNLYFNSTNSVNNIGFDWGGINGQGYSTLASFRAATGLEAHAIYANPTFVSGTLPSPNLHITSSTSKAINSGDPAYVVQADEYDIDGQARKQSTRVDIGADETAFTTAPSLPSRPVVSNTAAQASYNSVSIYPNPVSDKLIITTPSSYKEKVVTIYTEQGQVLLTQQLTADVSYINIVPLKPGKQLLLVKIVSGTETVTKKIIIR
jgi:hypothetical protein